jgi:hypothetical protein
VSRSKQQQQRTQSAGEPTLGARTMNFSCVSSTPSICVPLAGHVCTAAPTAPSAPARPLAVVSLSCGACWPALPSPPMLPKDAEGAPEMTGKLFVKVWLPGPLALLKPPTSRTELLGKRPGNPGAAFSLSVLADPACAPPVSALPTLQSPLSGTGTKVKFLHFCRSRRTQRACSYRFLPRMRTTRRARIVSSGARSKPGPSSYWSSRFLCCALPHVRIHTICRGCPLRPRR